MTTKFAYIIIPYICLLILQPAAACEWFSTGYDVATDLVVAILLFSAGAAFAVCYMGVPITAASDCCVPKQPPGVVNVRILHDDPYQVYHHHPPSEMQQQQPRPSASPYY